MMQKTYLSREMTRAMALDHPIGDPTGGPAYGERNDPISAVISIGTMLYTGGAVMAGTAGLMAGLTFAGAAVSLVGNITGNKTLSKIGMIAGLAGGIGSLAESAGLFTSPSMGATFGYGVNATGASAGAAGSLTQSAAPVTDGVQAGSPVADTLNVQTTAIPDPNAAIQTTNLAPASVDLPGAAQNLAGGPANLQTPVSAVANPGAVEAVGGVQTPTAMAPEISAAAPAAAPAASGGFKADYSLNPSAPAPGLNAAANSAPGVKLAGVTAAPEGLLSKAMGFAEKSPMAAYGAVNVAAQAAGGVADWLSGKTDAELEAMKAQTGYSNAKALEVQAALDKEKIRRANMATRYAGDTPTVSVRPNAGVTPVWQPQAPIPQPTGLIAGARAA